MTGWELRALMAEMLDAAEKNGYPTDWDNLTDEEIVEELASHSAEVAEWDREQVCYWLGDFRAAHYAAKEGPF